MQCTKQRLSTMPEVEKSVSRSSCLTQLLTQAKY